MRRLLLIGRALLGSLLIGLIVFVPACVNAQTVGEYPIGADGDYAGIAAGADGNLWIAEYTPSKIAIFKPDHTVIRLNTPGSMSRPFAPERGPDSRIWFSETNAIAAVNYFDYSISELAPPTSCTLTSGLVADSVAIWVAATCTESAGTVSQNIVKVLPTGTMSRYSIAGSSSGLRQITALAVGPSDDIWFTEENADIVGRFRKSTSTFAEFSLTGGSRPFSLVAGPDGNIWFFEAGGTGTLGSIDSTGAVKEFPWPKGEPQADWLFKGPDNNLWAVNGGNHVWRMTIHGGAVDFQQITSKEEFIGTAFMALANDGNLWYTKQQGSTLGVIRMDGISADDFEGSTTP